MVEWGGMSLLRMYRCKVLKISEDQPRNSVISLNSPCRDTLKWRPWCSALVSNSFHGGIITETSENLKTLGSSRSQLIIYVGIDGQHASPWLIIWWCPRLLERNGMTWKRRIARTTNHWHHRHRQIHLLEHVDFFPSSTMAKVLPAQGNLERLQQVC